MGRVRSCREGCKFKHWVDIKAEVVECFFLGELQEDDEEEGPSATRTYNHYVQRVRTVLLWPNGLKAAIGG